MKKGKVKKSGTYKGKSNKLGYGGRSAQLRDMGVPEGVIGQLASKAKAAPGMKNYHGKKKMKPGAKAYMKRVGMSKK